MSTTGSMEKQGTPETEGDVNLKLIIQPKKMMEVEEVEECKTPTWSGNQIPAILKCPPAPRKKKRVTVPPGSMGKSSAYKLMAEEVELFFKSFYEFTRANKRCKSI